MGISDMPGKCCLCAKKKSAPADRREQIENSSEDGMTGKTRENLVYGGIALASVIFLAWVIPTFTPPYPGYGVSAALLPSVAFGIILVLTVMPLAGNLISYCRGKSSASDDVQEKTISPEKQVHIWHLARFMIPCLLLMPAMKLMGFIPGGLLFMLLIQFLCGQRKPVALALVAVCSVGVLYAAMRFGLGVPMP